MQKSAAKSTQCAEHSIWTSVPTPPTAGQKPLDFSAIDAKENQRIISSEKRSFAMVGCSEDPVTGGKDEGSCQSNDRRWRHVVLLRPG
jgi:hypothetical protein